MKRLKFLILLILLAAFIRKSSIPSSAFSQNGSDGNLVYLPIISAPPGPAIPQVNVPFFTGGIQPSLTNQTAIFWFGRVYETENYADVRVGYTNDYLYLRLAIFDRQVWYNKNNPSTTTLTSWDAVALYLNLNGNVGNTLNSNAYAFIGQMRKGEPSDNFQAAYQGSAGEWQPVSIPFTSGATLVGSVNNDSVSPDHGWTMTYAIPFTSLGLAGPPAQGTVWGMALALHDRDDASGAIRIPDKTWPPAMSTTTPSSWAKLSFGLPSVLSPTTQPDGATTIRHGENGNIVKDGMVGGGFNCGSGLYSFGEWGEKNYAGAHQVNTQNQYNISDWPCFSKYYVSFPMDSVPAGVQITSATLTMMHFGNAGDVDGTTNPVDSLLQVLTIADDWNESTLTWNNAPLAVENISQTWVSSYYGYPPSIARSWDVSSVAAEAFAAGKPLRLAIYSADYDFHTGKYFFSSETSDLSNRPTLTVNWASP